MKILFLFITIFSIACGPALDANNFRRNSNAGSNSNSAPTGTPDTALIKQLEDIAKEANGKVGVSAVLIETGETVGINQNERFAMQSVVKLPISMAVMERVNAGQMTLEQKIKIEKDELVASQMHSPFRDENPNGGEASIKQLIELAVSVSDGTAADVLQRVAGGANGVQAHIDSLGIDGMKVRYTHKEFSNDNERQYENSATPDAAVALLKHLWSQNECKTGSDCVELLLLRFMTETPTGPNRIKGLLPPGTIVSHKTGTSGTVDGITAATNDVGIITLPNGNHIAIAVFVGDSSADQKTREGVIAKISRAIFDMWNNETRRNLSQ